jgi:hypothetical protein
LFLTIAIVAILVIVVLAMQRRGTSDITITRHRETDEKDRDDA